MVYKNDNIILNTKIGKNNFTIVVMKLGGKVFIYKNNTEFKHGQWFPDSQELFFKSFIFDFFKLKFENIIKENIKRDDITFPYFN